MAYSCKKNVMLSWVEFSVSTRPGTDAPKVMDIRLASTARNTVFGMDSVLNQLAAILLGELRIKMLPRAARTEPIKQKRMRSSAIRIRNQTPPTTKNPPMMKPIRMPYRSRIQLQGTANSG